MLLTKQTVRGDAVEPTRIRHNVTVDYLADPGRMRPYVEQYRARHPGSPWSWNYARYNPPAPVPAAWRVVYEPTPPDGPAQWPTTFPADRTKRMRLEAR